VRVTLERRRLAPNPLATLNQLTTPVIFPPESAPSAGSADGFSPSPSGGADASFTESAASSLANASPLSLIVLWQQRVSFSLKKDLDFAFCSD
jgi:hypothetical protein